MVDWILFYIVGGFLTADIRTERVTEAQCKAVYTVAPDKETVRCLSPSGEWYLVKPGIIEP